MIFAIVDWAFYIYDLMIVVYILLSWIPGAQDSPVGLLLARLVEPYLSVFRRLIPPLGMLDFSPLVALLALQFVKTGVFTILQWILGALG
jgi:YggT family protein